MLLAIAALLLCQILGDLLARWLGIPLPGALIGMALMLAGLCLLGRLPAGLRRTSNALLTHLMLLFIPSIVAIMTHTGIIAAEWLPFIAACIGGSALTLLATAATLKAMMARERRKQA